MSTIIQTPQHAHRGLKRPLQVDIWAVGVLAYELVMLEPPFYSKDDKQCESRIMMGVSLQRNQPL